MITKYYNASNHFSAPIIREPKGKPIVPEKPLPVPEVPPEQEPVPVPEPEPRHHKKPGILGGLLDQFEEDDLILLGLLLILISDSDDTFLTLIIGYLFISGF